MIVWTPTVFEGLIYACVFYFCICTCSAQLSMFHMEKRSRNTLIIISSSSSSSFLLDHDPEKKGGGGGEWNTKRTPPPPPISRQV